MTPTGRNPGPLPENKSTGSGASSKLYLDITRLLWRAFNGHLTGIDRVELAYARYFAHQPPSSEFRFVVHSPLHKIAQLPHGAVRQFIESIDTRWAEGRSAKSTSFAAGLALRSIMPWRSQRHETSSAYLNVSGFPLWRRGYLEAIRSQYGLYPFVMVHDLIPMKYPEYVPGAWVTRQQASIEQIQQAAAGVIANSKFTASNLLEVIRQDVPICASPLGVDSVAVYEDHLPQQLRPYFVCLGTIEPRKNHLTLLHAWQQMADVLGDRTPNLKIVGRVGWKCDHILKMIRESRRLSKYVEVVGWIPDHASFNIMRQARAVLAPSFTEGYGLPVAEALQAGVPVICSDIPPHREIGGNVPEYVEASNTSDWINAIRSYKIPNSSARIEQLRRLANWKPTTWDQHIECSKEFIFEVLQKKGSNQISATHQTAAGGGGR